jgi:hypothetical protein
VLDFSLVRIGRIGHRLYHETVNAVLNNFGLVDDRHVQDTGRAEPSLLGENRRYAGG